MCLFAIYSLSTIALKVMYLQKKIYYSLQEDAGTPIVQNKVSIKN